MGSTGSSAPRLLCLIEVMGRLLSVGGVCPQILSHIKGAYLDLWPTSVRRIRLHRGPWFGFRRLFLRVSLSNLKRGP